MFINKKYKHRQKILATLHSHYVELYVPDMGGDDYAISHIELAEKSGLKEDDIWKELDFLHTRQEIFTVEEFGTTNMIIQRKGTAAYHDNTHILEGKSEYRRIAAEKWKFFTAPVLLLITVVSFCISLYINFNKDKEIDSLHNDIDSLKRRYRVNNRI